MFCGIDTDFKYFSVLTQRFPQPDFVVKPEYRILSGRPDLIVAHQSFPGGKVDWVPDVLYEGKASPKENELDSLWEKVREKLYDYADAGTQDIVEGAYCIGAVGKGVMFWHYHQDSPSGIAPMIADANGRVRTPPTRDMFPCYRLDQNDDLRKINAILAYMVINSPQNPIKGFAQDLSLLENVF